MTVPAFMADTPSGRCVVCIKSGTVLHVTFPNALAASMGLLPAEETDPVVYEAIFIEADEDIEWDAYDSLLVKIAGETYREFLLDESFLGVTLQIVSEQQSTVDLLDPVKHWSLERMTV